MRKEIGFVCIGQAGGNVGNLFDELGFNVLYINTSKEDLETLKNAKHIYHIPGGEGCYKNRNEAKKMLSKVIDPLIDKIKAQFKDVSFIGAIFGTGGGTGSGISPYLIDILVNEELFDSEDNPTHTVFTVPILPDINETPLARLNSYECFSELADIENLGATYPIDNTKPSSYTGDYNKYKLSLNKRFVSSFCSFIDIPDKHKSELGIIDKAEIKELIRTPGMSVISVTGRKVNTAAIIDDLENSTLFAPIDTDVTKRKLKYIASSTIDPLNYQAMTQAFGTYMDEYHTFNQEKNIVCLCGLRLPYSKLNEINESVSAVKEDILKSLTPEENNPLKENNLIKNLRGRKPRKRQVVTTTVATDSDGKEVKGATKKRSSRRSLLDMYGK